MADWYSGAMDVGELRRPLLAAVASALGLGCGPSVPSDTASTSTDGGGTNAADDTGGNSGTTVARPNDDDGGEAGWDDGPTATPFDVPAGDGDDDGILLDVSLEPPNCPPQPVRVPPMSCPAMLSEGESMTFYCLNPNGAGECLEALDVLPVLEAFSVCLPQQDCGTQFVRAECGPLDGFEGSCCYWAVTESSICPGRPFLVEGRERLAVVAERSDWQRGSGATLRAPAALRAALANAWTEHASFEHASVASFSRFTMHLLACGAPAELVRDAARAMAEEIEHAELFFGFASDYAGRPRGPGPLPVDGALDDSGFESVVLAAVREGCIAETVSAWHVRVAASHAADERLAAALERVAEQEMDHAILAWRFLAWAMERATPALRVQVAQLLSEPHLHAPRGAQTPAAVDEGVLLAHGILSPERHAAETERALLELVVPTAALFGPRFDPACATIPA